MNKIIVFLCVFFSSGSSQIDFLETSMLEDGEQSIKMHYKGIYLSILYVDGFNVQLLEISDGHGLLQLITKLNSTFIYDCDEITNDLNQINYFLKKFWNRPKNYENYKNLSGPCDNMRHLKKIPEHLNKYVDYGFLRWQCLKSHKTVIDELKQNKKSRKRISKRSIFKKKNDESLLQVPGTKWCGKGFTAKHYNDLGYRRKADKCCREHDAHCPHYIPGWSEKYNYFNWRISTMMHCHCDNRFRICLKGAETDTANFVGNVFFNVMGTKCFTLRREKVCVKSWWGHCTKFRKMKVAVVQSNKRYNPNKKMFKKRYNNYFLLN